MTVDKPPLALWVQALSVRAFGFSSLEHAGAAGADGRGDRRRWCTTSCAGASAAPRASSAGLALALTPVTVAISRHNNPDALLVLCVVARRLVRSCGRWRTAARAGSSCAGVCVGLGFETKMGAALLVVPGARRRLAVGRAARRGSPRCASCSPAARRWSSSALAWPLLDVR